MKSYSFSIKSVINYFLELIFPSWCLGCHLKGQILCDNCINKLEPAERPTEESIIAVYDYRDPLVKKIIWELKYYNKRYLGEKLGELLYNSMIDEVSSIKAFSNGSPICVIPVPISSNRKKHRGYNQSELIARNFCFNAPLGTFEIKNNIIYKKVDKIPQAKITNRNERLKNVKGVFGIKNNELIKNKVVIIIDDVTTTGGTILEIMKLLKQSGVRKVLGFTIAH